MLIENEHLSRLFGHIQLDVQFYTSKEYTFGTGSNIKHFN